MGDPDTHDRWQILNNLSKRLSVVVAHPDGAIGHPYKKSFRVLRVPRHSTGSRLKIIR